MATEAHGISAYINGGRDTYLRVDRMTRAQIDQALPRLQRTARRYPYSQSATDVAFLTAAAHHLRDRSPTATVGDVLHAALATLGWALVDARDGAAP
jgi:hypothetical protein